MPNISTERLTAKTLPQKAHKYQNGLLVHSHLWTFLIWKNLMRLFFMFEGYNIHKLMSDVAHDITSLNSGNIVVAPHYAERMQNIVQEVKASV